MTQKSNIIWGFIILILVLHSCAKPATLSGGIEDEFPPKLIVEKSTKNLQTQFRPKEIILEFDEFIEVRNTIKEVIVSPPTEYLVQVESRAKKLTFKFDEREVLKENATYQINFGKSIKDFTAGNTLENFVFVFSTGDQIDSLSLEGQVVDEFSGNAESDILVMLYDNLDDSIFYKERPFYFTRTDSEGAFKLQNLRADTFQIFALKDANLNYYFDQTAEKIAYSDSLIFIGDTATQNLTLYSFLEKPKQSIITADTKLPGLIQSSLANVDSTIQFTLSDPSLTYESYQWNDSLFIYYQPDTLSGFFLETPEDTFKISARKNLRRKFSMKSTHPKLKAGLGKTGQLQVQFSEPISSINDSLIIIRDTLTNYPIETVIAKDKLFIEYSLEDTSAYELVLLPGAVSNLRTSLPDSIVQEFKTILDEDLGNIFIELTNLKDTVQYVIELMQGKTLIDEVFINGISSDTLSYTKMPSGDYSLNVLEDRNRNGAWDPGNYGRRTKSEKTKNIKLDKLRKGWDLNFAFDALTFTN